MDAETAAAIAACAAVPCALHVIAVDWRRFEICFESLALMALTLAVLHAANAGSLSGLAFPAGCAVLCFALCQTATWISPSGIGLGDRWLFAACGTVCAGPDLAALYFGAVAAAAPVTSLCWSAARGKKPFRSSFPMAIPALIPAIPLILVQGF